MSTTTQPPIVPAVHKVHALATVSAVISCIGLLLGNLIGLVLSVVALRHMDTSPERYHGYRMVFTGWFMGLVGLIAYPIFLIRAKNAYATGDYAAEFAMVVTIMVVAPLIMIVYAWQDRLSEAETFKGYQWLGEQNERHPMDIGLGLVLLLAGALLISPFGPGTLIVGIPFVIVGLAGPAFKRRGMRVLMGFLIVGYIIQVVFHLAIGSNVTG